MWTGQGKGVFKGLMLAAMMGMVMRRGQSMSAPTIIIRLDIQRRREGELENAEIVWWKSGHALWISASSWCSYAFQRNIRTNMAHCDGTKQPLCGNLSDWIEERHDGQSQMTLIKWTGSAGGDEIWASVKAKNHILSPFERRWGVRQRIDWHRSVTKI